VEPRENTFGNTLSTLKKAKEFRKKLGLTPQIIKLGLWQVSDGVGFQTATEEIKSLILLMFLFAEGGC